MKKSEAFPSRFFKFDDVTDCPTLTIASVKYETLKNHKGNDEQKPVVSFLRTKKCLVVNATNFDAIVEATGEPDSDDWPSHSIQLFGTSVQVGSEPKACVRVRKAAQGELKAVAKAKKPPPKVGGGGIDEAVPY